MCAVSWPVLLCFARCGLHLLRLHVTWGGAQVLQRLPLVLGGKAVNQPLRKGGYARHQYKLILVQASRARSS